MLENLSKIIFENSLINKHQSALIPLEQVGEEYFKCGSKSFKSKFLSGELKDIGLIAFRCSDTQKSPILVHVSDLASFLLKRREVSISA